jgi:hypothetical protein
LIKYKNKFEFLDDWLIHIYEKKRRFKYHEWAGLKLNECVKIKTQLKLHKPMGAGPKDFI